MKSSLGELTRIGCKGWGSDTLSFYKSAGRIQAPEYVGAKWKTALFKIQEIKTWACRADSYRASICLISWGVFFSVSGSVFSTRRCGQPQDCEKGGIRSQTSPSCFWRRPLCSFSTWHSFMGRACRTYPLGEYAWWPFGGNRDLPVIKFFVFLNMSCTVY